MKQITLTICSAAILLFSCNNDAEKKSEAANTDSNATKMTADTVLARRENPPPVMDSAAMMKAWMAFATPGDNHKWMAKMNGTWESEVSQWMAPGAPPTKSKAVSTQKMILGGRYCTGSFTGTMMGQPFEGMTLMGYDNAKKMFVSSWVDNMGTGIVRMSGTYDEATKTLHMKGTQTDAMTGKDTDIREEMTIIDDNSYSMAMYGPGMDGKEMKFMEGTFVRKK